MTLAVALQLGVTSAQSAPDSIPASSQVADAPFGIDYEAEAILAASSGSSLAPYYMISNRHGILTQKNDALVRLEASRSMDRSKRFSYGFGVEAVAGYAYKSEYMRWDASAKALAGEKEGPSAIFLQQLYGEIKYRQVFLEVGMKERTSALLNSTLSSGDLVESGNARPIPQVRVGFIDFVDIPFTNGWVQIQGDISYGKFADNGWMKSHYNYYNYHINLGALYTYKRCYFRTNPEKPFSVTFGMQTAGLFGGTTSYYSNGEMIKSEKWSRSIKTFFKMFLPIRGDGNEYYEGNSLGSWDIFARYRFSDGTVVKAYLQKPWEDGSGIGWLNGFDGLWGLEYAAADKEAIVSGAVVEYLDFTNQSGGIHWAPEDSPGTNLTSHTDGGDQYYNNFASNSYMNYGMSIGTPFLPAPIYNSDGYMAYVNNRVRGFHVGISGTLSPAVTYRLLGGYRKGWGDSRIPVVNSIHDTSVMAEANYRVAKVPGLEIKAQVAYDNGNMLGNNFGGLLSVTYRGRLDFSRK